MGNNGTVIPSGVIRDTQGQSLRHDESRRCLERRYGVQAGDRRSSSITTARFLHKRQYRVISLGRRDRGQQWHLFGTASEGGIPFEGTVFKLAAGTSSITTLASFNYSVKRE